MLYFYYGSKYDSARTAARTKLQEHIDRDSQAPIIRLDSFSFSPERFDDALGSQGLFGGNALVELKDVLEIKEAKDFLIERLADMGTGPSTIIWTERSVDERTLTAISKHTKEAKAFGDRKKESKMPTASFDFAEKCVLNDKRKAWVLFETELRGVHAPEELIGTLMWQYKMVALAHRCATATDAGVSPYSFTKAKTLAQKCSAQTALTTMHALTALYHRAHRGELDLEVALERFILDK